MFKLSLLNLSRRPSRTFLSLIGIMVGVIAITSMVSVVDGMSYEVQEAIGKLQTITVMQKGAFSPMFSQIDLSVGEDIERRLSGVRVAVPQLYGRALTIDGKDFGNIGSMTGAVSYLGVDFAKSEKARQFGISGEIVKGRQLNSRDEQKVMIGKSLADRYDKFVGNSIKVNGERFEIIGIYTTGSSMFDNSLVMPFEDARSLLSFPKDKTMTFSIDLFNPDEDRKIAQKINFMFPEVEASSANSLSEQFGDIINNLRLLVFVVAGLSALIAGIGIANTMLMSVMERFKEIGALKAVGWTAYQIVQMILLESMYIGIFGGIIGVVLSFGITGIVQDIIGLKTLITIALVLESFIFAVAISIIAGLYPAIKASRMTPIDALREGAA